MTRRIFAVLHLFLYLLNVISCNESPTFVNDLNNLVLPENTEVGTIIGTLKGSDPEGSPLHYGIEGTDLLSVDADSGEVKLVKPFDREINDTLKFVVTAEDEVNKTENKVGNNVVKVDSFIIVDDVNDNAPKFVNTPYEFSIDEDTIVGTTIFNKIQVEDIDLVGEALDVVCISSKNTNACEKFAIVSVNSASNAYEGAIVLKEPLNYNEQQLYQLVLIATDGQYNVNTTCDIRISDVQNLPPSFQSSLTAIVQEDAPIGTSVITLQARDGDRGVPRHIVYDLINDPFDYFLLDANTGELHTAKPLDRENVVDTNGVLKLTVRAREVESGVPLNDDKSSVTAEVSITIRDVNDEPPKFNKKEYRVRIPENLPNGSPLPNLDMIVTDTDLGNNSAYSLKLNDVSGAFTVEPATAIGSTTVIVRLTSSSLDYENPNQRKFIVLVIAEDIATISRLSSTATLIVEVTDTNDNAPKFENPTFTANVNESALPGTYIAKITAMDRDTGGFGVDSIVYELIGDGAEKFNVDKKTGIITVAFCPVPGAASCLDYETKFSYFLTYKATDEEGKGQGTSVPLKITLTDSNDNIPIFKTINYTTVIDEGANKFEPPFFVEAEDKDKTSSVTYSIANDDAKSLFGIDRLTGEITILNESGLFRNNDSDTVTFTVAANDGTFATECVVNVKVLDVNNNAPEFILDEYSVEVPEDATIGKSVIKVRATDKDTGVNADVSYRIERGGFEDFSIDNDTGVIKVASKLDYDKRNAYNITVVATDGGTPMLTGSVTVFVYILNTNDKNPYLKPFNQRTEVPKDAPLGTKFYQISAFDPDTNDTNALRYKLAEPISAVDKYGKEIIDNDVFKTFFGINEENGKVFVAEPLQRDIAAVVTLSIIVRDTSAKNVQEGKGTLMITILDVNDIPPSFSSPWSPKSPYFVVNMQEELPVGSILDTFTATDRDSEIHHYAIEPTSEYFALNETTGTIWTRKRIDYETVQSLNFTLVAYDVGEPQLSTKAVIFVNVTNVNDNGPIFEKHEYEGTVKENSPKDTPVLKVSATDADLGDFGKLRYVFKGDSNDFVIDEQTGAIKIANSASLDRERLSEILLKVEATDQASKEERRSAIVPVTIKIEDTNDNPPVFSQHHYSANIVETIPYQPASPIVQLHAKDPDDKGRLRYHIVNGNDEDAFNLDFGSGILYPKRSLLGLLKQFRLTVEVTDGKFTDTAIIEVNVLDVNQNKPFFVEPSSTNASVLIPENVEINHLVAKVSAEDKDPGDNGRVTYHFKVGNNNTQFTDEFSIDENTGELKTIVPLDRENRSNYQLIIIAKDHGTQTTYETIQFLTVILKDVDDNKPKFVSKGDGSYEYTFTVNENNKENQLIGKIIAEDPDDEENAKIYYYIIRGNENQMFSLDRRDGSIYALDTLDRERSSSYEFYAKATNNANYNSAANEIIAKGDPTIARVVIVVKDENDNVPYFVKEAYYAGVKFDSIAGEYVTDIKAFDLDEGIYGELNYSIQASYLYRSGSNNASGIVTSPFSISSDGRVTTNNLVSSFNQYRFELTIVATEKENPSHNASVSLNVWVYQIEQLVRAVVSQPPDTVKSQINNIVGTLKNVTGNIVVVDAIRHYADTKDPVRRYWSDLYIHMVDDTQTIMPTDNVLTIIDGKFDHLIDLYKDYAVQNFVPAYTENMDQPPFEFALAALVALTIVLMVGCVSVLILCCCFRHWIVMEPLDMKCDMLIKKPIIDDLSTTENPLWIEQKLKLYEEQELTMQVFCEPEAARLPADGCGERRRDNDDTSTIDNTYATIQQPGRRNSANTMLSMGPGDYATLGGSVLPLDRTSSHSQQMIEAALGFQGCTFQVPEIPADTTELLRARSELRMNKDGQPEFVSELM